MQRSKSDGKLQIDRPKVGGFWFCLVHVFELLRSQGHFWFKAQTAVILSAQTFLFALKFKHKMSEAQNATKLRETKVQLRGTIANARKMFGEDYELPDTVFLVDPTPISIKGTG